MPLWTFVIENLPVNLRNKRSMLFFLDHNYMWSASSQGTPEGNYEDESVSVLLFFGTVSCERTLYQKICSKIYTTTESTFNRMSSSDRCILQIWFHLDQRRSSLAPCQVEATACTLLRWRRVKTQPQMTLMCLQAKYETWMCSMNTHNASHLPSISVLDKHPWAWTKS